jgi:hypothetical protein
MLPWFQDFIGTLRHMKMCNMGSYYTYKYKENRKTKWTWDYNWNNIKI